MKTRWSTYLDLLATIFGTIGGAAQLLVVTNRISQDDGLLISGLATIALGIVANKGKSPYTNNPKIPPNYFPYEFGRYDSPPYNDPYYEPPTEISPKPTPKLPGKHDDESSHEVSDITNITQYHSRYIGQSKPNQNPNQEVNKIGDLRGKRKNRRRFKPLNKRLGIEYDSNSPFTSDFLSGSQSDSDS